MRRPLLAALRLALLVCSLVLSDRPGRADDFVNFESAHVDPIALSEDGRWLFAVNTPEARLAIFRVARGGRLEFEGDVRVGLEPVSLAVRPGSVEVWVANHLSDTVSVVDGEHGVVLATLDVGDEPTDVVFASGRAFVSLSGGADRVAVFDAGSRERIATIDVFGDDPRAMTVSPDGSRVGLVVLESGNGTTVVHPSQFTASRQPPAPLPPRAPFFPPGIGELPAPVEPLIVRQDPATDRWLDETGADWSDAVFFGLGGALPDKDLFWIDAEATPPVVVETVSRVGTTLFDVDVHPRSGEAWVVNTEARNVTRFEPNLRGHVVETRITRVGATNDGVEYVDLNPHIDRRVTPGPAHELERSLAIPVQGVFSPRGRRYYLAAFGSATVAVLDGRSGAVLDRIAVGGGPSGVALGRQRRLYVMERFANTIATVDLRTRRVVARTGVAGPSAFDPSPPAVRSGRRFLYDGRLGSGHGDIACASCHVFGNFDGLAWDLGDPQGDYISFRDTPWLTNLVTAFPGFDPMKGPMVTQTLRGLKGTEPFHWRGDRADFQHFNEAFVTLMGRDSPLSDEDMDAFADFIMTIEYPPNPFRLADDTFRTPIFGHGDAGRGEILFRDIPLTSGGRRCADCHQPPFGTSHQVQGLGQQSVEVAQLRNIYEKLGRDRLEASSEPPTHLKSGFGIQHHGAFSVVFFLRQTTVAGLAGNLRHMSAFLASFSTGTHPCVGRQVELPTPSSTQLDELAVLIDQARIGSCDLIASGHVDGTDVAFVYDAARDAMVPDRVSHEPLPVMELIGRVWPDDRLTFTAVPTGTGRRSAIDRDRDTCLDGDELRQGTDPARPGTRSPDADHDGIRDALDLCPGLTQRDREQRDIDSNGRPDECECGDVSNDGRVSWRDVYLLWRHLRAPRASTDIALPKCNVSGPPGPDPEHCTSTDLAALIDHIAFRWWQRAPPLPALCLPAAPPTEPASTICADD